MASGCVRLRLMDDVERLRTAIEIERARTMDQIANLERSFAGIVDAAELTSTDDEHDPEGATIAYERAQVSALLRQARDDLVALDGALERIDDGTIQTCAVCGDRSPSSACSRCRVRGPVSVARRDAAGGGQPGSAQAVVEDARGCTRGGDRARRVHRRVVDRRSCHQP